MRSDQMLATALMFIEFNSNTLGDHWRCLCECVKMPVATSIRATYLNNNANALHVRMRLHRQPQRSQNSSLKCEIPPKNKLRLRFPTTNQKLHVEPLI